MTSPRLAHFCLSNSLSKMVQSQLGEKSDVHFNYLSYCSNRGDSLCGLVAGLLFACAIVTMPGIKSLNDGEFVRAFQVMDGVIQNNQPLFMLVWKGSTLSLLLAAILGFGSWSRLGKGFCSPPHCFTLSAFSCRQSGSISL